MESLSVQARNCPDDFEVVFVERGRLECESWYRARRTTITRWLEECGKQRLLKARSDYVRYKRLNHKDGKPAFNGKPIRDRRKVPRELAEMAVHHLQGIRNGGWVIYRCECGDYMTGTRRRSPAELVDLAESKGFNRRRALHQIKVFSEPV